MRRISLWAASTVSVLVLLFGYHTSTSGPEVASAATPVGGTSATAPTTTGGSSSGSSGGAGGSDDTGGSSSSSSSGGSGGSSSAATTYTGEVVSTRWGPVQVSITVSDGTITAVDVPQYPNGNHRDQEINSYALPRLVQETLDKQSGDVDMISGATVTSVGYQQSLQSALDQAGL